MAVRGSTMIIVMCYLSHRVPLSHGMPTWNEINWNDCIASRAYILLPHNERISDKVQRTFLCAAAMWKMDVENRWDHLSHDRVDAHTSVMGRHMNYYTIIRKICLECQARTGPILLFEFRCSVEVNVNEIENSSYFSLARIGRTIAFIRRLWCQCECEL